MRQCFGRVGRISAMMALTLSYFVVEITVGHLVGSLSLVADSFHMLSDVVALAVGLAAVRISKMQSEKSTFGWVRAEVLGALVNAVFLIALCFTIFVDALQRLITTEVVEDPKLMLIVGSVGLGINILGLFIFHGHAHGHSHGGGGGGHNEAKESEGLLQRKEMSPDSIAAVVIVSDSESDKGKQDVAAALSDDKSLESASVSASTRQLNAQDQQQRELDNGSHAKQGKHEHKHKPGSDSTQLNMRGIFLHVLGDALGSVVVIVSALLIWLVPDSAENDIQWKPYLDPAMSLLLVAIIMITTVPLLKESGLILLQAVPTQFNVHKMQDDLEQMDGVLAVHELHMWQLTGSRHIASLHLSVASLGDYVQVSRHIKKYFHDLGIHSVTIQPEFEELHAKKEGRDCALECGPEKSCYTDTCCGKKSAATVPNGGGQRQVELLSISTLPGVSDTACAARTDCSAAGIEVVVAHD